jgi:hypothetical protein
MNNDYKEELGDRRDRQDTTVYRFIEFLDPNMFYHSKRQRHRTPLDLLNDELLPLGSQGYENDYNFYPRGIRFDAIVEVLTTLPPDEYERIKSTASSFRWHLPGKGVWGSVGENPTGKRIYLTPLLECVELSRETVVGLVAHEIAHLILDHDGSGGREDEAVVESKIIGWGFAAENEALTELHKLNL